jgi:hypothetical protein
MATQLASVPRRAPIYELVVAGLALSEEEEELEEEDWPSQEERHCLNMLLQLQRAFLWHATRSLEGPDMMRLPQITTLTLDVSMSKE